MFGTNVRPLIPSSGGLREVRLDRKFGVTVAGGSRVEELDELVSLWKEVVEVEERNDACRSVMDTFKEWRNYAWPSPDKDFVRYQPRSAL